MDQLVTIGRFSRMTRLSRKALRLYDRLGLLTPADVDPSTGYRSYAVAQANRAEAIRLLRSVGLGLQEIGALLDADDREVVAKALRTHRERLEEELHEQRRRLALVERLIREEEPLMPYTVTEKDLPDVDVVAVRRRTDLTTIGDTLADGFGAVMAAVSAAGGAPAGAPFVIYHDVIDEETPGTIEICVPVAVAVAAVGDAAPRTLPGGAAATTVHRGPYDELAPAYHVLHGWMGEHDRTPAGPPRELYLNDPSEVPPAELLTEVQWPVA